MGDKCFVAINIVSSNNTIENPNSWPIIFYWDGESDIISDMKANENFMTLIHDNCLNETEYDAAKISIIYINNIKELQYKTEELLIQDFIPFDVIDSAFPFIYVTNILYDLYEKVYHESYPILNNDYEHINESIVDMFKMIKEGVKRPVQNETIINYVSSQLIEQTKLSPQNRKYLIEKITEIIKES